MPVEIKDYPSNSDKSKENGQKVSYNKPTINGKVSVKRKNVSTEKLKEQAAEIKRYTVQDVILPGLKDVIWDIATTALNTFLFGRTESATQNRNRPYTSSIQYSSTSNYNRVGRPSYASRPASNRVSSVDTRPEEEFIFERKSDADTVLDELRIAIANFGVVSVQSLFEMCNKTAPFTANKFGWMNLDDAYIERTRDGYAIRLPRSLPLD
mgnify:CR=1 FL=1